MYCVNIMTGTILILYSVAHDKCNLEQQMQQQLHMHDYLKLDNVKLCGQIGRRKYRVRATLYVT